MGNRLLQLDHDLQEHVIFDKYTLPLVTCIDNLDDYYDRSWDAHWHEGLELQIVLNGTVEYTIWTEGGQAHKYQINSGNGIFINNEMLHRVSGLTPHTQVGCLIIPLVFFDIQWLTSIKNNSLTPILDSNIRVLSLDKNNDKQVMLLAKLNQIVHLSNKEIGYELHTLELFFLIWRQLLLEIKRQSSSNNNLFKQDIRNKRVRKIIQFIYQNYSHRIDAEDMAKFANISRAECFRSFKSVLNQTPTAYLNNYRLSMATMLLTTSNKTISTIAESCGYQTVNYFNYCFRKKYKVSPSKYRSKNAS